MAASYTFTYAPIEIRPTAATLSGVALVQGTPAVAWFEWGSVGSYTNTTAPLALKAEGALEQVRQRITGLEVGGVYQCRVSVSNASGVVRGAKVLFTTGQKVTAWGRNAYGQTDLPPNLTNVVALEGGKEHCIAILSDGSLRAWGEANYGQLAIPADLTNVIAIAAGRLHNVALRADGTVAAWGWNASGIPAGLSNVVAVAAGDYHSMVLKADGSLVGWGDNSRNQLEIPPGLSNVVAITSGNYHNTALKADGTVVAWSGNVVGETNVPPWLTNVAAVVAGGYHTLALLTDGTLTAFGGNWGGQCNVPAGLHDVVSIAAGWDHSLAMQADGSVMSWGYDDARETVVPTNLVGAVGVAAGHHHSLALTRNLPPDARPQMVEGTANGDTLITLQGKDPNGDSLGFRIVSLPPHGVLYQYAGGVRGSAILAAGTLVSDSGGRVFFSPVPGEWGTPYTTFSCTADDGELQSAPATVTLNIGVLRTYTSPAAPVQLDRARLNGFVVPNGNQSTAWFEWHQQGGPLHVTPAGNVGSGAGVVHVSAQVTGLAASTTHECRLVLSNATGIARGVWQRFATGGRIAVWGDPTAPQYQVPPGLTEIVAVSAWGNHCLALNVDGMVTAWGGNEAGEVDVPPDLWDVAAISAGYYHSLALLSDGRVTGWGNNGWGQLNIPAGLSNVVEIAAGHYHTVVLQADGTVLAWGDNESGQSRVPPGLSNVVAVAAGGGNNLALKSDGTVVAWGSNELGEGSVPPDLNQVVAVACGYQHSLALRSDGSVVQWGGTSPNPLTNVVSMAGGPGFSFAVGSDGLVAKSGSTWGAVVAPPAGLSNVVQVAAGQGCGLAIGPNSRPLAAAQALSGSANQDLLITLAATDLNADPLLLTVATLPAKGRLYQWSNGQRGAAITAPGTPVADEAGRLIFAPGANEGGKPYTSFTFQANDGEQFSEPGLIQITIIGERPTAFTLEPQRLAADAASLGGMALPNGLPATAWFEWGARGSLALRTLPVSIGAGLTVQYVTSPAQGLAPGGVYQCRLVVSNTMGMAYGATRFFTPGTWASAWGLNTSGQGNVPVGVSNFVGLAAADVHTLALLSDGTVTGWGGNGNGQLNFPSGLGNVARVAAGGEHSLALRADTTVTAWGLNNRGQTSVPAGLSNVVQLAPNRNHNLALLRDGRVTGWGYNGLGQLNFPADLSNVVAVAAGYGHGLAVKADGTLSAWGWNAYSQVVIPDNASNWIAVAAGYRHSLALNSAGLVVAWGASDYGQATVPAGLSNVVAIAAGDLHSLALKRDGTVVGWGYNYDGRAVPPAGTSNVITFWAGAKHSAALRTTNHQPQAVPLNLWGLPSRDLTMTLTGTDFEGSPLTFIVKSLPAAGSLYHYSAGGRGAPITAVPATVSDAAGRLIFSPLPGQQGNPYATFSYTARDATLESAWTPVTVRIGWPATPSNAQVSWSRTAGFGVTFSGEAEGHYCVWTSTNLSNWLPTGSATPLGAGSFHFADPAATNAPRRFYKIGGDCP